MDDIDRRFEEFDRKLEQKLGAIDASLEERLAGKGKPRRQMDQSSQSPAPAPSAPRRRAWRLADLSSPALESVAGLNAGLDTPVEELVQIAAYAFHSPHVLRKYSQIVAEVDFLPVLDDDWVNAQAMPPEPVEIAGEVVIRRPIVFYGGAANATRLGSLAIVADQFSGTDMKRNWFLEVIRRMGLRIAESGGEFSTEKAGEVVGETGLGWVLKNEGALRCARSYGAGANLGIVAHELGHHVLGHVLGPDANLEITRNQEREADLFADSVVSSSPFGDYLVAGQIMWWLILVWVENSTGERRVTTHPWAAERLMNCIRDHRDQAAQIGVTAETVRLLLPDSVRM
ncbi:MAG: hypothetical protein N2255_09210 [Kiritimatiellae bacterium]|nr:hypothetical protein [Kiritimatiellia bacterium]